MAASTGQTGAGVLFQVDLVASPVSWVTIANVTSINPTGIAVDEIDFTHLQSSNEYREFRPGFKDGGTINIDFHFNITEVTHYGTVGLIGLFNNRTVFNWRVNFAAVGWAFALIGTGFVSNPGDLTVDVDNPIQGSATVRVTGPVTRAAVA